MDKARRFDPAARPQPGATGDGRRSWLPFLLLAIAAIMLANGLQQSLLQLRSAGIGMPAGDFGFAMAFYYVGFLVGSLGAPYGIRRVGHRRLFALLCLLGAGAALLPIAGDQAWLWAASRALTGIAFAGFYVIAETWLNLATGNERRGDLIGLYMSVQFAALAFSQIGFSLFDPLAAGGLLLAALFFLAGLLLIARVGSIPAAAMATRPAGAPILTILPLAKAGFLFLLLVGFAQGAFWSMAARWAAAAGLDQGAIAWFLGMAILGAGLAQWPLGRLADRFDRARVMILSIFVAILAAIAMGLIGSGATFLPWLGALYGAGALTLYSLGNAWVNDRLPPEIMIAAGGLLVLAYGLGAILGAALAGQAILHFGPAAFMVGIALAHIVMLAPLMVRRR